MNTQYGRHASREAPAVPATVCCLTAAEPGHKGIGAQEAHAGLTYQEYGRQIIAAIQFASATVNAAAIERVQTTSHMPPPEPGHFLSDAQSQRAGLTFHTREDEP